MSSGDAGKRKTSIGGQFVARPRDMNSSPAMRVMSLAALRALSRIEEEHMAHGGAENGKLPVTYRDFENWGINSKTIASAIREVVALGFVEVSRRGYGGAAEVRAPSLYRLTYLTAWDAGKHALTGTHEYRKIATVAEAEAIAKAARKDVDARNVERGKNHRIPPLLAPTNSNRPHARACRRRGRVT